MLLQNEHVVSLLSEFRGAIDAAWVEVGVVFDLLGMNNKEDVDVVFGCQVTQLAHYFVLKVEFVGSVGLVWQHELQVVEAHDADVVRHNWML